jgi:membrane-associated PAP2 superfamily phosphatase
LLKTITNVDCPWDLLPFGGKFPYEHLFADRPDGLRHARCFPAAHASSGYSLMALYFLARERSVRLARRGLIVGIAAGLVFGFAQQSRGAHFLSHDLCSAMLAWLVPSALYSFAFRRRIWSAKDWPPTAQSVHSGGLLSTDAESPINAPAGIVTALP